MGDRTILGEKEIGRVLKRMAYEMLETGKRLPTLVFIGIHTRGVYLAHRFANYIKKVESIEIPIGEIDITLYRDDWTQMNAHPVVKTTEIPFSVDDKHIILVDDVLFTGRTIRSAMDAIIDFGRPSRIELAVLIDRGHRELPIQSNYTGLCIKTERSQMVNVLLREVDAADKVVLQNGE